jgi:hypothetical protein
VGGHALLVGLLPRGGLGLQPRLGLVQPRQPVNLAGKLRGQLVAAGAPNSRSSRWSISAAWRRISATSASSLSCVRLALSAALPASLVPSKATVPTPTMPAAPHSFSDATRKPARACSWRTRKRAMVT